MRKELMMKNNHNGKRFPYFLLTFLCAGSGKTLTTEYTGTVIIDEVTDEVVADIDDPRDV